jgi:antitoxin CptB
MIAAAEDLGKLRWRCRRGMKELDLLLERYVEERFAFATAAHQRAFRELLEIQDPVIHGWCFGGLAAPTPELRSLIEEIIAAPRSAPAAAGMRDPR